MHFTPSHEWIICDKNIGTVGITLFAQKELGEIVYVELPQVGAIVKKGEELAVLESTKAAADIYAPVSGKIIEVNNELIDHCGLINEFPETKGWICKIALENLHELTTLLTEGDYSSYVGI